MRFGMSAKKFNGVEVLDARTLFPSSIFIDAANFTLDSALHRYYNQQIHIIWRIVGAAVARVTRCLFFPPSFPSFPFFFAKTV